MLESVKTSDARSEKTACRGSEAEGVDACGNDEPKRVEGCFPADDVDPTIHLQDPCPSLEIEKSLLLGRRQTRNDDLIDPRDIDLQLFDDDSRERACQIESLSNVLKLVREPGILYCDRGALCVANTTHVSAGLGRGPPQLCHKFRPRNKLLVGYDDISWIHPSGTQ